MTGTRVRLEQTGRLEHTAVKGSGKVNVDSVWGFIQAAVGRSCSLDGGSGSSSVARQQESAAEASQYNGDELDRKAARTPERRREGEVFKIQDFKISDKYFAHRLTYWSVQREREGMLWR